jgi:hypothetical protein
LATIDLVQDKAIPLAALAVVVHFGPAAPAVTHPMFTDRSLSIAVPEQSDPEPPEQAFRTQPFDNVSAVVSGGTTRVQREFAIQYAIEAL